MSEVTCVFTCVPVSLYVVSGVPPPGPGVMVMQLSVPNGPQPSQNPPLVQWNPCKYYSIEQRPGKPGELYKPDNAPQVHTTANTQGGLPDKWVRLFIIEKDVMISGQHSHPFIHSFIRTHKSIQSFICPLVAENVMIWWGKWRSCFIFCLMFYLLCLGQYPADQPPGLPHSVSHPISLRQRQQCLSRPWTITPHFPVSSARRTSSRYIWPRWWECTYRSYPKHRDSSISVKICNKQVHKYLPEWKTEGNVLKFLVFFSFFFFLYKNCTYAVTYDNDADSPQTHASVWSFVSFCSVYFRHSCSDIA